MAEARQSAEPAADTSESILELRVVSPEGARVRETVIVLSEAAEQRLQTTGKIPPS